MSQKINLNGCGPALVTPFHEDGSLDVSGLEGLVDFQIENGIDFIVPCGTTGESATLEFDEHLLVVETVFKRVNGRIPVIAGAGGYNTAHVIEMAKAVEKIGVDAILSVTPYYNKPSQEGLYLHYKTIAETISLPIVLYNVPGRTATNLSNDTVLRLSEIENIVALKEATGNLAQMTELAMRKPEGFVLLSGDDANVLALIALGGSGLISVAANEAPRETTEFVHLCLNGDFSAAVAAQKKLFPLMTANFIDTNPVPVKYAMAVMGKIKGPYYRLPLTGLSEEGQNHMKTVLKDFGLIP